MKALILGIVPVGVAGGMYLHGDFEGGQIYDLPVAQAYRELSYMPVPTEMAAALPDLAARSEIETVPVPDHAVKWVFRHNGAKLGTVTAEATASGDDRTRVVVSYAGETLGGDDPAAANVQDYVRIVGPAAMQAAIGAAIQNRPFGHDRIMPVIAGYVATHAGAMMQQASSMMETSIRDSHEADRADEARQAIAAAGLPTASAKPMLDLSKN